MANPHIPPWLEDVTAHLKALYEAEAVFLVGSHARGTPTPASGYDLLVVVDNDRVPERGMAPRYRWDYLEGFAAPVHYLRSSLAELMAGAYAAEGAWVDLLHDAYPLHDPMDYRRRFDTHGSASRTPGAQTLLAAVRRDAAAAARLQTGEGDQAATLAVLRAADHLAGWMAREAGMSPLNPRDVTRALGQTAPGVARAFGEVLAASDASTSIAALERFIDTVEATIRLREPSSG